MLFDFVARLADADFAESYERDLHSALIGVNDTFTGNRKKNKRSDHGERTVIGSCIIVSLAKCLSRSREVFKSRANGAVELPLKHNTPAHPEGTMTHFRTQL